MHENLSDPKIKPVMWIRTPIGKIEIRLTSHFVQIEKVSVT